jgi:hypothetical protein
LDSDEGLDDSHVSDSNDNSMSTNSDLDLSEIEFRNGIPEAEARGGLPVTSSVNGLKKKLSNDSQEEFTNSVLTKSGQVSEHHERVEESDDEHEEEEQIMKQQELLLRGRCIEIKL